VEKNVALLGQSGGVCEREGIPIYVGVLKGIDVQLEER
jgi:hypothetical protein